VEVNSYHTGTRAIKHLLEAPAVLGRDGTAVLAAEGDAEKPLSCRPPWLRRGRWPLPTVSLILFISSSTFYGSVFSRGTNERLLL